MDWFQNGGSLDTNRSVLAAFCKGVELDGINTFLQLWGASVLFFLVNAALVSKLIKSYEPKPLFGNGMLLSIKSNKKPLRLSYRNKETQERLCSPGLYLAPCTL